MNLSPSTQACSCTHRPPAMMVSIALIIVIQAVITFASVLDEQAVRASPLWFAPYATISSMGCLIAAIGILRMRSWAVHLYTVLIMVKLCMMIYMGTPNLSITLFHTLILAILYGHRSQMKPLRPAAPHPHPDPEAVSHPPHD